MKSNFKDRLIVMALVIIFLAVTTTVGYITFSKHSPTGVLTSEIIIVDKEDFSRIEQLKNRPQDYAFLVQDGENSYLRAFRYSNTKSTFLEHKFTVDSEQLKELSVNKSYWFYVKFSDPDNPDNLDSGKIKKIYTSDPAAR